MLTDLSLFYADRDTHYPKLSCDLFEKLRSYLDMDVRRFFYKGCGDTCNGEGGVCDADLPLDPDQSVL